MRFLISRQAILDNMPRCPKAARVYLFTRHGGAVCVGVVIMLTGSGLAASAHEIAHVLVIVPHILVDAVGYFLHGVGALPIMVHIEPAVRALAGSQKGGD